MEINRSVQVSPFAMFLDDEFITATKRVVTSYSDVRDTALGPIDFGWVHIGPEMSATEDEWRSSASAPSSTARD